MDAAILDREAKALLDRYSRPSILLHRPYLPRSGPIGRSFFGGLPTLPDNCDWPRTPAGMALHFFCQVDCADIGWGTPLPESGILFFFGRDDEEQVWGQGMPEDDCRVIYVADASACEHVRQAPADLPPIGGHHYPRNPFRDVTLDDESPRRVHVQWPLQPLPMKSFPDTGGLPPLIAHDERVRRRAARASKIRGLLRHVLPQISPFPVAKGDAPDRPVWNRYDELVDPARADAFEAASGQKIQQNPFGAERYDGVRRLFEDEAYPYFWILIQFFARAVLRRHRYTGRSFGDEAETPEAREDRTAIDEKLDAEALNWLDRSCAVPLDVRPTDAERREYRAWAADILREPADRSPSFCAVDWSRTAARCAILEWAADSALASKLPRSVYESVSDLYQLCSVEKHGARDWHVFEFSQMLGHAPSSQATRSVDDPEVCLLNLASDRGLGWSFGDAGECSFWMTPSDLAARDFSRVHGMIMGH